MRRAWNIPLCAAISVHAGAAVLAWVVVPKSGDVDPFTSAQMGAIELTNQPEAEEPPASGGEVSGQATQFEAPAEMLRELGFSGEVSQDARPTESAEPRAITAAESLVSLAPNQLDVLSSTAANARVAISHATEQLRLMNSIGSQARETAARFSHTLRERLESAQHAMETLARARETNRQFLTGAPNNVAALSSAGDGRGLATGTLGETDQRALSDPRGDEVARNSRGTASRGVSRAPSPSRGNNAPEYPIECRRLKQEGTVLVRVTIEPDGRVSDVSLAQGSGFDALDQAALIAVGAWRFVPAARDGVEVQCQAVLPVVFRLTP